MKSPNESWAVSVERNGENVVTLSSSGISGRGLTPEDERVIEQAALRLLSFIGSSTEPWQSARRLLSSSDDQAEKDKP